MTRTRSTSAIVILALGALCGCDTISQDLTLLSKSITPPTPREAADMMVDPHNADNRREGTVLIANSVFGDVDEYVRWYRLAIENPDEDPTVKAVSVRALAQHGGPEDAVLVASQLDHENEHVRWEAAKGLQRLHNVEAVTPLLNVVRDDSEQTKIRVAAAHALGQYPQDRVFQALIGALQSRHLSLNLAAEHSLTTLTGQSHGLDAREWSRWYRAVASEERFAGQQEYRYQTYMRDETLLEKLAFWTSNNFEHPGTPAGLDPINQRRTYDDSDADTQSQ